MTHPEWWPRQFPSPHLCLKHRTETVESVPGMPRTAIMYVRESDQKPIVLPWRDDNPTEFGPPIEFADADAVLAAGWIVD